MAPLHRGSKISDTEGWGAALIGAWRREEDSSAAIFTHVSQDS